MATAASFPFPGRRRKIAPFVLPEHPGEARVARRARSLRDGEGGEPEPARHRLRRAGGGRMGGARARRARHGRWRGATGSNASAPSCGSATSPASSSTTRSTSATRPTPPTCSSGCTHNAVRYAFVATDGPVILWDFHNCEHLSWHLELIDEIRHGTAWHYYEAGEHGRERARRWAAEIADILPAAAAATGGSRSTASIPTASRRSPSSASRCIPARR